MSLWLPVHARDRYALKRSDAHHHTPTEDAAALRFRVHAVPFAADFWDLSAELRKQVRIAALELQRQAEGSVGQLT